MTMRHRSRAALSGLRAALKLAGTGQSFHIITANIGRASTRLVSTDDDPVSSPPHALSLYHDYLRSLQAAPNTKFYTVKEQLTGAGPGKNTINIVLRHDLDAGDYDVAMALAEQEKQLNLRSTFHILVDGDLYNPEVFKSLAPALHKDGFDVGLHTQAWIKSDSRAALFADIQRFEDLYGFSPRTFSFHGAWPRTEADLARRWQMVADINLIIEGSPLVGYTQQYHWIGEDSNVKGKPAPLRKHFFELQSQAFFGGWSLLLTHDNHWKKA